MNSVKVLVAHQQRLMREIVVAAISQQPNVTVVAEVQEERSLLQAVEESRPDVVILALGEAGRRPALLELLLRQFPALKVIGLAPERNQAFFYWISPEVQSRRIECCEQGLLTALLGTYNTERPPV